MTPEASALLLRWRAAYVCLGGSKENIRRVEASIRLWHKQTGWPMVRFVGRDPDKAECWGWEKDPKTYSNVEARVPDAAVRGPWIWEETEDNWEGWRIVKRGEDPPSARDTWEQIEQDFSTGTEIEVTTHRVDLDPRGARGVYTYEPRDGEQDKPAPDVPHPQEFVLAELRAAGAAFIERLRQDDAAAIKGRRARRVLNQYGKVLILFPAPDGGGGYIGRATEIPLDADLSDWLTYGAWVEFDAQGQSWHLGAQTLDLGPKAPP